MAGKPDQGPSSSFLPEGLTGVFPLARPLLSLFDKVKQAGDRVRQERESRGRSAQKTN